MNSDTFDPTDVYAELPEETIRILVLEPGATGDDLRGSLELHKFLNEGKGLSIDYEALSYTWGEAVFPQRILCGTTEIPITWNLFDALCHIRQPDARRNMWIDALCINQRDNKEKSKQIPMMRDIFANAKHVIVWLGPSYPWGEKAWELLQLAARCARAENKDILSLSSEPYNEAKNIQRGFPSREGPDGDGLEPLCSLFSLPWFSRVWVFQEVANACSAYIKLGPLELPYFEFCLAVAFFPSKSISFDTEHGVRIDDLIPMTLYSRIGSGALQPVSFDLYTLLRFTRRFLATEPRDKIFALLGVADNGHSFPIDYSISLRKLYVDVAWFLVNENPPGLGLYQVLVDAGLDPRASDIDLPSWVSQWGLPRMRTREIIASTFRAGGKYISRGRRGASDDVLEVDGWVLGNIKMSVEHDNHFDNMGKWEIRAFKFWKHLVSIRQLVADIETEYPTGQTWDEVFAQVLTAGSTYPPIFGENRFTELDYLFAFVNTPIALQDHGQDILLDEWSSEIELMRRKLQNYQGTEEFFIAVRMVNSKRKLLRIEQGLIGIGPHTLRPGDLVCILFGGLIPYVLRPNGEQFIFLGECYVHGIMNGEALEEGQKRARTFSIV
jgi:hypothetical protein